MANDAMAIAHATLVYAHVLHGDYTRAAQVLTFALRATPRSRHLHTCRTLVEWQRALLDGDYTTARLALTADPHLHDVERVIRLFDCGTTR
jgi:hypothetical protein